MSYETLCKTLIFSILIIFIFPTSNGVILGEPSWFVERPRRLKEMIKHDISRSKAMSQKAMLRLPIKMSRQLTDEEDIPIEERQPLMKSTIEGAVKLRMYASAEFEMGEYVVDIDFGSPPTTLHLIVDTATDLTWVKCKNNNHGILTEKGVLDITRSKTYKPISCDTLFCKEDFAPLSSLPICPKPSSPCLYNYSYGDDGLSTYGIFGKEIATLATTTGKTVILPNLLIGCSESYTDRNRMKHADGVLGLGINPFSFSLQAVNMLGGSFSYCLVDHLSPTNVTNFLIFGNYREKSPTNEFMRYTTLIVSETSPYYWVNVKGISMDKKLLEIDPKVWRQESEGGTIIDSGSAATYWAEPAYQAIMGVLLPALETDHPKLVDWNGDGRVDFQYCFNSTATPLNPKKLPRLEIHFSDGARFKPLVKSYIVDDGPHVSCIGFLMAPSSINIIGNIMQQNYLWEFDLHQTTLGFVSSTCQ